MSRRALAMTSLAMLVVGGMAMEVDLDAWHLMALARESLREGWVPFDDRFAFTPTVHPSVQHEWGMGMVLYAVGAATGTAGLLVVRLLLVGATCGLAWRLAVRRGASEAVLVLLGPTAIVMSWIGWTLIRAQVFTLLLLAILLTCLDGDRRGARRWIGPWLVAWLLWVNLHGGMAVGLAVLLLEAVERRVRGERVGHLVGTLAAMVLLVAVNPYGWAYYPYLSNALTMDRGLIAEWRPLLEAPPASVATVALAMTIAIYAVAKAGLQRAIGWPLLLAAAYEAVRHERHVSLFALVWFTQVPPLVSATRLGVVLERLYARARVPVLALLFLAGATLILREKPWRARIPGIAGEHVFAVGPVQRLAELRFHGNVLVPFNTGAYVLWKLHPEVRVSIDSRYEVAYPHAALVDHLDFYRATPRWRAVLAGMPGADLVLAERSMPVAPLLAREPGWSVVYDDDAWLVFARPGLTLPYQDRRGAWIEGTFP